MTPLLKAEGLALAGRLSATDLQANEPALIALIGPNGGGKTSLLRALAGVEDAQGHVAVAGEAVSAAPPARRARLLAFLPASREMIWPIAARDVIAMSAQPDSAATIEDLLDAFELRPLANRPISSLSTGERTRVLIARALAARPRLLLLDEPFANLDPYWVIRIREMIRATVERDGTLAIVSLHDLAQVDHFDRLLLVNGGKLSADDKPATVIWSDRFQRAFRVMSENGGWAISSSADPRSLR